MQPAGKRQLRCAIYTRKSTEHNLDLEFNSLDAQREACEAYVKSQAHEGWRLTPERYDDGAFSGASLDRPALQRLLADIRASRIDTVVVYKVDRLTRALADFAKLVELFDAHAVSFVSITQSFNTTSSMGRLTLNVLLSFAQFEREVIAERVRDKIAASKRKGLWVGGPIPLGYVVVGKKLNVVPQEAETVRLIFRGYLELGSIGMLAQDLERRGIRTKRQVLASGKIRGHIRFGTGALSHLLKSRFYVGEVVYRGERHRGEHEPIVEPSLFEAVQQGLAERAAHRQLRLKASSALFVGHIYDDRGNRMTPTHSNKQGVRYRYYVSHALLQSSCAAAGTVSRVPAPDVEAIVLRGLRAHLEAQGSLSKDDGLTDRDLVAQHVDRIVIGAKNIRLHLRASVIPEATAEAPPRGNPDDVPLGDATPALVPASLVLPWAAPVSVAIKGVLHSPPTRELMSLQARDVLLRAIAKARSWVDGLAAGRASSFAQIAEQDGKVERHVRFLATLAFVSPRVIAAIMDGSAPADLTVTTLAKGLPHAWAEQERRLRLNLE